MTISNEASYAELGFGDVVQYGKPIPDSDEVLWIPSLEVVAGPVDPAVTKPAKDVSTWSVIIDDETNEPFIGMTGTTPSAHIRRYGTLTVEDVEPMLVRGWSHTPLAAKKGIGYILDNYLADASLPPRQYECTLHEVTDPSLEDLMRLLIQIKATQDLWQRG